MDNKIQLLDCIFNLALSFSEETIRLSPSMIIISDLRIAILGIPGSLVVNVKQKNKTLLDIFFYDNGENIFTVLQCLKLLLFHELKFKKKCLDS